jgi:hypothetical protein
MKSLMKKFRDRSASDEWIDIRYYGTAYWMTQGTESIRRLVWTLRKTLNPFA